MNLIYVKTASLIKRQRIKPLLCFTCILFFPFFTFSQSYQLTALTSGENTSWRGLSLVSDRVAWVSGSNGHIGKSIDGGKNWNWMKPAGYEQLDFRDIHAFDENHAVIINAGSPAYILVTDDGGKRWRAVYKNLDSAIFLDGMDFWDPKNGIIFGDPIQERLQLLITADGGLTWKDASSRMKMKLAKGEAGFAASGTSITTKPGGKVWIATGGSKSNVYRSDNYGLRWKKYECPILQGSNSTGAFSLDFYNQKNGIVVGGDYLKDKENAGNVLLTTNGGQSWHKPISPVFGYRSCVVWFDDTNCFATGTSGTDASKDEGRNWQHISDQSFNVIAKSKNGNLILAAGNKGEIYSLKIN